jgi:hypothetical protein
MVWFKVDDRFHGSDPVKRIPREKRAAAIGLWTLAGTWSAQFLKNGFVPAHLLDDFCGDEDLAGCLVDVGLWRRKKDGFIFADWAKWQPTREKVEAKREADAKRSADYRARNAANKPVGHDAVTRDESVSHASVRAPRPDPTRPDPKHSSSKSESAAKRGSRVPEDFTITDAMREWAKTNAPLVNLDQKLPEWVDYWRSVSGAKGVQLDWVATWRNGMRKQQQWAVRDTPTKPSDDWMNR